MSLSAPISRRNLFRRTLGIHTREAEHTPGKTIADSSPENVLQEPVSAQGAAPEKTETDAAGAAKNPAERLRRVLEEEPEYADVYRMVLTFCFEERSMPEIEYLLRAHPALANPIVYPSYLVDRLEFAGALEWIGKWRTTEAGREPLV